MAFQMRYNKEELKGQQPVPAGLYTVVFVGFKPKMSKSGDTVNLNPIVKITGHPDYSNRNVFTSLNSSIPQFIQDFCHSFGLEMEDQMGEEPTLPGVFDADKGIFKEDDLSTWRYAGPLTAQTAQWELGLRDYQGTMQQSVRKFICKVPDCVHRFPFIKHSNDMDKKSS
jgi:hypothetical protein